MAAPALPSRKCITCSPRAGVVSQALHASGANRVATWTIAICAPIFSSRMPSGFEFNGRELFSIRPSLFCDSYVAKGSCAAHPAQHWRVDLTNVFSTRPVKAVEFRMTQNVWRAVAASRFPI